MFSNGRNIDRINPVKNIQMHIRQGVLSCSGAADALVQYARTEIGSCGACEYIFKMYSDM